MPFKLFNCVLNPLAGAFTHVCPAIQHPVDRGQADAGLQGDFLHEKAMRHWRRCSWLRCF
ncbi:hypothetical protein CFU_2582 [Collimonas fungivorans Ter331]|uniref:Uncharacterized protein n=1 Tax=Collimonas fungivorans (strain Ter331) TaxID=1005048 RepID=G0AC54_COLFT|nr:hypothetical protein CFU_2582 [Collimonas fungivorans Ter331]